LLNIGILASTKGTDMQAIIDAIDAKKLNARISVVISDKKDSYALERAKKHGIRAVFIDPKSKHILKEDDKSKRKELFDKSVAKELGKNKVELVLLIGYMRFVSPWLVGKYRNRIMNIHPSLLPKFAGITDNKVHQAVLEAKEKETGCTLHFVDETLDGGPIIMQSKVAVSKDETPDSLKKKVQKAEQETLVKALGLYRHGKIRIRERKVMVEE